jgi:hypothetical protein
MSFFVAFFAIFAWVRGLVIYFEGFERKGQRDLGPVWQK